MILNYGEDSPFEEDLAKDVLEIITAQLYGSRSRKNQKLLNGTSSRGDVAMLMAHRIALNLTTSMQRTSHGQQAQHVLPTTGRWPSGSGNTKRGRLTTAYPNHRKRRCAAN